MPDTAPAPSSLRALARLVGVSDRAIRNALRDGVLDGVVLRDSSGVPFVTDLARAAKAYKDSGRQARDGNYRKGALSMMTMEPVTAAADAAALVEKFEALPVGVAFADAQDAARSALDALDAAAARALIADVEPIGADVLADYDFYTASLKRSVADVAALHARCLASHPQLARLLRNRVTVERIAFAQPIVAGQSVALAEVEAGYVRLVASALRAAGQAEPWATLASDTLPALRARFRATATRHADHVASEAERLEAERREAAEAVARAERQRREEIADFFLGRSQQRFIVRGRVMSGMALDQAARGRGVRDDTGEVVSFTFVELETAYKQAVAAAAVVA